jgi:hypothetical protein
VVADSSPNGATGGASDAGAPSIATLMSSALCAAARVENERAAAVYAASLADAADERASRHPLQIHLRRAASRLNSAVRALTRERPWSSVIPNVDPALAGQGSHVDSGLATSNAEAKAAIPPMDATPAETAAEAAEPEANEPVVGLYGHSSTIAVPEILGFLSTLRKTGTMRLANDREGYRIRFEEGTVVYAHSEHPPEGLLLGEILVQQGAIEAEAMASFLARNKNTRALFGATLLREGLVTPDALRLAVAYQAQRIFNRAYLIVDAHYWFEPSATAPLYGQRGINVTHLLLESARSQDETANRLDNVFSDPFEGSPLVPPKPE